LYLCGKKQRNFIFVNKKQIMPELLLLCFMLIPQIVAGVFAQSQGRNFWFWFFISFLLPIISLLILLFLDSKKEENGRKGYDLADHVVKRGDNLS
jgi:hypothetical protein